MPRVLLCRETRRRHPGDEHVGQRREIAALDEAPARGRSHTFEELLVQPGIGHLEIAAADENRGGRRPECLRPARASTATL